MTNEPRDSLERLDPARRDPGYWHRFHRAVMRRAAPELALLRAGSTVTVSDVVSGWGRAVVPTALLVATFAALMVFREPPASTSPPGDAGIEEMLADDLGEDPIPVVLASEGVGPTGAEEEF